MSIKDEKEDFFELWKKFWKWLYHLEEKKKFRKIAGVKNYIYVYGLYDDLSRMKISPCIWQGERERERESLCVYVREWKRER